MSQWIVGLSELMDMCGWMHTYLDELIYGWMGVWVPTWVHVGEWMVGWMDE